MINGHRVCPCIIQVFFIGSVVSESANQLQRVAFKLMHHMNELRYVIKTNYE